MVTANIIYVCWIPFYLTEDYMNFWPFGTMFCKFHTFSAFVSYSVTNFVVTIISADRYTAICHPSRLNVFETYTFSMIASILVWPVAVAFRFVLLLYTRIRSDGHCRTIWPEDFKNLWFILNSIFGFLLTSVVVLIMYVLMIIKIRRNEVSATQATVSISSNRASTNLALMIALVYLLCWTPYWFIGIIRRYGDEVDTEKRKFLLSLSLVIGVAYSAINPVLYLVFDSKFRKCFNNIFGIKNTRIRRITTDALNPESSRKEHLETTQSDL